MIAAGAMNRRIRVEGYTSSRDPDSNELIQAWGLIAEVWAHRRDIGAREFLSSGAENTEQLAVFTVWWRPGITPAMRIISQGQVFNITGVSEVGFRQQLQLQARAVNSNAAE
jgi:SPP1 family predicted phage head-tail adaptor